MSWPQTKTKTKTQKRRGGHTFLLVHKSFEAGLSGLGLSPSWFESVVARGRGVISSLAVGSCINPTESSNV